VFWFEKLAAKVANEQPAIEQHILDTSAGKQLS